MVKKTYVPKRGDVVWLNFSPTEGHEESGRRPSLVLSPKSYNELIGLAIVCPITQKTKGYTFEVPISLKKVSGVILSDHIKSIAFRERNIEYIGQAIENTVEEVIGKVKTILEVSDML
jgi:mRNA interferase MazF